MANTSDLSTTVRICQQPKKKTEKKRKFIITRAATVKTNFDSDLTSILKYYIQINFISVRDVCQMTLAAEKRYTIMLRASLFELL